MSRIHRLVLGSVIALSASLAAPSNAALYVFDPPAVDRWMYPFASSAGARPNAPLFGAFATAGMFDQRDAEMLVIFDTAPTIPAGRPPAAYTITSARVIFDRDPATTGFTYDPTYDGYRTYLALENPSDPNQLPDTDAGRPIELFGVGYRLAGLNALTYDENLSPFGPSSPGAGLRYAYPNDYRAHPTLFGDRDVANNVAGAFEASPFAVGTVPGATPGSTVSGAGVLEANVTLTPAVIAYLRNRLAQGSVDLMATTLTPAAQGGPQNYALLLNKESGTGAATLEIDVTWTAACADGIDNDGDTLIDYPADDGCRGIGDDSEQIDCQDGIDNDGDGFTDYPADTGCQFATSPKENPQCSDGIDNDGDTKIDYPADPHCGSLLDNKESPGNCGLLGVEVLPLFAWAAWRQRRKANA